MPLKVAASNIKLPSFEDISDSGNYLNDRLVVTNKSTKPKLSG